MGQPTLVFVNGFGCDQGIWQAITPDFANSRRILTFDHVGTGGAERAPSGSARYASLHGYAQDLLQVCEAAGDSGVIAIGHSVGAMIALLAAVRSPSTFRQLVLIGPSPCFLNDGSYLGGFEAEDLDTLLSAIDADYRHWAHQLAPLIMGNPSRPELARELEASFSRLDPDAARQFARVSFASDHRADLALVRTRTALLQCAEDDLVPEVVSEFVRDAIRGCELVRLEATGHCPLLSAPEEICRVLRELLDERWSSTEPAELGAES